MAKKKTIILTLVLVAVLAVLSGITAANYMKSSPSKATDKSSVAALDAKLQAIMDIIKTDKDYPDFLTVDKNFYPVLADYEKLGPAEYKIKRAEWIKQNLSSRTDLLDKLQLTDSTYWVELKNKNDENKGLLAVIDTKQNKSLLIIATVYIKANVGGGANF